MPLTDPLTALHLTLITAFAVGLILTSGRRRPRSSQPAADAQD